MAMTIRQNPTSLTTLRHASNNFDRVKGGIEQLSSGTKINRGADGPASLIASERLRGHIVGLQQAYNNASTSVSLIQTAEGGLNEVSEILVRLKQLTVHAANEAVNDPEMLDADQMEIEHLLGSVDRIARNTQFNGKTLLDGSMGANGVTVGDHLRFVEADPTTPNSPESGWEIDITQVATQAQVRGTTVVNTENIRDGLFVVISENGKNATLDTRDGQLASDIAQILKNHDAAPDRFTAEQASAQIRGLIVYNLQKEMDATGTATHVFEAPDGTFVVRHNDFGDHTQFSVTSSVAGVLSKEGNVAELATSGKDVEGTINGEVALGEGQILSALEGTTAGGASIAFTREIGLKEIPVLDAKGAKIGVEFIEETNDEVVGGPIEGYLHISQQSKDFPVHPNNEFNPTFSFLDVRSRRLGQGVMNKSGFESLADIDVTTLQGAQDANRIVEKVIDEVSSFRARLGAFQKNALEANLESLKIAEENITSAESMIRDSDVAETMSKLTSDQIMLQASTAMIAQANQVPRSVLGLVEGAA